MSGLGLPEKDKTWQYYINKGKPFTGTATTDAAYMFLNMKIGLTTFSSNPWTVVYSCNGTTAGTAGDGVDRWGSDLSDTSNIVHGAGPANTRSWIVLKQTGIATNFQICIDLIYGTSDMDVVYSYSAGFTGGTTTARPTATDEIVLTSNYSIFDTGTTTNDIFHMMMSTDGQVTRMFMCSSDGLIYGILSFEVPKFPPTEWTTPHVCLCTFINSSNDTSTYDILCKATQKANGAGAWTAFLNPLTNTTEKIFLYLSTEGCFSDQVGNLDYAGVNQISGKYEMYPVGVLCTLAPFRGRHGTLYDLWFIPQYIRSGTTFATTGSTYVSFGVLASPWDGSTIPNVYS